MATDWTNMALAMTMMILTVNGVLFVGFTEVGYEFKDTSFLAWANQNVLGYAEDSSGQSFSGENSLYSDTNVAISESSTTAEGTSSSVENIPILGVLTGWISSVMALIDMLAFAHLYVMGDLLNLPAGLVLAVSIPLGLIQVAAITFLLARVLGVIRG